jgi:hypothetical protein
MSGAAAIVVAGCAMHGLTHLPVVLGPVYAAGPGRLPATAYRVGAQLVEPGFVDVYVSPRPRRWADIDFIIWSVSARRLRDTGLGDQPAGLFLPGACFLVLDVSVGPERSQVLLLDLVALRVRTNQRPPVRSEPAIVDTVTRLRQRASGQPRGTGVTAGSPKAPASTLRFLIGLDDSGRPYLPST